MFGFGSKYENISVSEVNRHLSKGALLIDIRNEDAFKTGHIKGAVNIPMKSLPFKMNELDKNKELLVICYVGGSSKLASKILSKSGFKVKNVIGGMEAWKGEVVAS